MSRSKLDIKAIQKVASKQESEPAPEAKVKPETKSRYSTTVYLDKEFHTNVKIALLREGQDRDFNRLVNDLLREWYETHAS